MITVVKANGEKEPFNEKKLRHSIQRAGIPDSVQEQAIAYVTPKLYENIPTYQIFRSINEFLGQSPVGFASAKYSLKSSLMALGPTGYPFEDYVAHIFQFLGFTTTVRTILQGMCVSHEIDVIAEKSSEQTSLLRAAKNRCMVEVKFHHLPGAKTDVHVALYTKARFDDIKTKHELNDVFLVTNTKISSDAINYALCVGMKIISWSYPQGESLRELVEKAKLIPVTALTTLSTYQKQLLLENHIVLCKDICQNPSVLNSAGILDGNKQRILEEAQAVCQM